MVTPLLCISSMRGITSLAAVKTIKAVAELWPLALIGVALLALILAATMFRKETRILLRTAGSSKVQLGEGCRCN